MARPRTRYAKSGDVSIAYQVVGEGPLDLVYVPGWISSVELTWEEPSVARFFERLASFSRLIQFDKRGTGLSDRDVGFPTLEDRMDDVRAVMDAIGSARAALLGMSEGGNMSMLFAATYPDRTIALLLFGCFARRVWAADYPGPPLPRSDRAGIGRSRRSGAGRSTSASWHPVASRTRSSRAGSAPICGWGEPEGGAGPGAHEYRDRRARPSTRHPRPDACPASARRPWRAP